jgi:hypothetical protein
MSSYIMKKILFVVLAVLMLSTFSYAKDKGVVLTWTQVLPTPNDLKGWMIYYSEVSGGPYKELAFVEFRGVQAVYSYESGRAVGKMGNKKGTMYFVIKSVDNEGNLSAASSQTSTQVDGEKTNDVTPPAVPGDVSVGKK